MSYPRLQFLSAVESVDEGTKKGVSQLLSEASRLLPSSTFSNAASNSTRPAAIPQAKIAQNNSQVSEGAMTGIKVKPGQDSFHESII